MRQQRVSSEKPILITVLEYGEFPELLRVAVSITQHLDVPVIFWFIKENYRRLNEDTRSLVEKGFLWVDASGRQFRVAASCIEKEQEPVIRHSYEKSFRKTLSGEFLLRRKFRKAPDASKHLVDTFRLPIVRFYIGFRRNIGGVVAALREVRKLRRRYHVCTNIMETLSPSLVVVGQDAPGSDLAVLLKTARDRSVPRMITPFAMVSLREVPEYISRRSECNIRWSALNRVISKVFPRWLLFWEGEYLLRLPGPQILAIEYLGLTNGSPWIPLSEPVEVLTVESESAARCLANLGLPLDRVKVVGSPVHDRLSELLNNRESLKRNFCCKYNLDPTKPMVLCGWPVNLFPWLAGRKIEFNSYDDVANAWASILVRVQEKCGVNVVVSVHPKALPNEYRAAKDCGLTCVSGKTDDLIAICDLFTSLNGTSITAWAIACGVPTVLFDCFKTKYEDFENVPGCNIFENQNDFEEKLLALCSDGNQRENMANLQRTVSTEWGVLDGGVSFRLAELVKPYL